MKEQSLESLNKYLFSENERLNATIDELEEEIERQSKAQCILDDEITEANSKIDKAIEILKDTSVDMPSTLLMETIDYARHILGDDNKWKK